MLVLDTNGAGTLGAGTSIVKGFGALAALDANHDGVIDSADPAYGQLAVWGDGNANGSIDPGELYSLAGLGIQSISLATSPAQDNVGGNLVTAIGQLTFADGSSEALDDVTFGSAPQAGAAAAPLSVGASATLEIPGPATTPIVFSAPTGTLRLDASSSFAGQISGFGAQDKIDLADIAFGPNLSLGLVADNDGSGSVVTVADRTNAAQIAFIGQYTAASFAAESDGHAGTLLVSTAALTDGPQPLHITLPA
jgi:hypothetical protein